MQETHHRTSESAPDGEELVCLKLVRAKLVKTVFNW